MKGAFNDVYLEHRIWIRSKLDPGKPVVLYSYGRDADISWSPDSTMVAITDFEGSSNSHVVIFRISPQLGAEEITELTPFVESRSKTMLPSYDHFYAQVVGWSVDSQSLTIELRGDLTEWDVTQTEYTTHEIKRQVIFRIPDRR
jgi:hypothetical protein